MNTPEYIFEAKDKPSQPRHNAPLIRTTNNSAKEHSCLVLDPENFEIKITRWPAQGRCPIDGGTEDEGGFSCN